MHRRETERTTRMNRDELLPPDLEQAITARTRLTDIRAAQARDHAVTTPMPRSMPSEEPIPPLSWVPPPRKQTLRMGALVHPPTSDARIQAPTLAVGSGVANAVPPAREIEGAVVSFAVAASLLIAFFAVYACI